MPLFRPFRTGNVRAVSEPFRYETRADWAFCDPNGHLRNSAYLDLSVHCRMRFLDANGFPVQRFAELGIGPAIRWERADYRREVRHLEPVTVELWLAAAAPDVSRFRFRNVICKDGDEVAATVEAEAGWIDLRERRLTAPPDDLAAAMRTAPPTEDFEELKPVR
jgi:acyl-CoA thioester hydrolase